MSGHTGKATVILFKSSGKYYTEEEWTIPDTVPNASGSAHRPPILPCDMEYSPDFRRIDNGKVLVVTQEPWGYPHLL